jgi:dipeptidyl aminopeptidase/acylaminoacyl peptidase
MTPISSSRLLLLAMSFGITTAYAATLPAPLRYYMDVATSPDKQHIITVEGDTSASGGSPTIRDLIVHSIDGKTSTSIKLPCGRVKQCWPESPVWTPDSQKITFALRSPGSHARSLYQVNFDGSGIKKLVSFNGTISDLMYNAKGQLAMLATENATKELGAVEAGAPITGDLDKAPPEQRIATLVNNEIHFESPANLFVYEYDWIPDGSGFVGTAAEGDGDNNWWVAKLFTFRNAQASVLYTPSSPQQQLANPIVSRDGKSVAFIGGIMSDFGSTGGDVYAMPLSGGSAINVTPKLPASVTSLEWNCNGDLRASVLAGDETQLVNFGNGSAANAGQKLYSTKESVHLEHAKHTDLCKSDQVAMVHQTFTTAPEIALGEIGHWHDFTHANAHLKTAYRVESLNWKSDQFTVQGWLILPVIATQKLPLITIVHGGPAAANRPRFIGVGTAKSLLDKGYALFLPNPRGSYGQGEEFTASNVRDFGYGDLRDILSGVDAAIAAAPIDPNRLGIMGHSYGGFMTMWAVTQTNRFKAAVAGAGISNWLSYYGENGIDEWMIPYFGKSVYDDPEVYAKSSAINFIRQVRTPTLSMVGAADVECPAPQTQEFGHALKALGIPSSTVIYPGEGHAFRDPATLADQEKRTLDWFATYLK